MKKTTQNKTKLNSKSKYEGMALFDIEKDLLKVSEVKSSKLDLGLLDKEYKALFASIALCSEYTGNVVNIAKKINTSSDWKTACEILDKYLINDRINLKEDTLQNIWDNSEKIKWLRGLKMKDLGNGECCKCDKAAFCAPCMVRNANESPTGNPLEINRHFCAVAQKNKEIVLNWREAQFKKSGK